MFKAPPKSQSHGLHPARSLLRPQYSGYRRELFFSPCYYPMKSDKDLKDSGAAAGTHQTLVAVAARHVSFAGAVAADLVARSPHHDDATRVTVACCCKNTRRERKELMLVCVARGDRKKKKRSQILLSVQSLLPKQRLFFFLAFHMSGSGVG